jgi:hypothetical protein
VCATAARPLLPPRIGAVDRPPRPLHTRRMQPPPCASSLRAAGLKEKLFSPLPSIATEHPPTPLCLSPSTSAPSSPLLCRRCAAAPQDPLAIAREPHIIAEQVLPTLGQVNNQRARTSSVSPTFLCHSQLLIGRSTPTKSTPFATSPSTTTAWGTSPTSPASPTSAPLTPHRSPTFRRAHRHYEPTPVSLPPSKTPNWVPHLAISL